MKTKWKTALKQRFHCIWCRNVWNYIFVTNFVKDSMRLKELKNWHLRKRKTIVRGLDFPPHSYVLVKDTVDVLCAHAHSSTVKHLLVFGFDGEQPSNRPAELRIGAFHQLFLCSQNIFKILKLIVLTILPLNVVRSTDAFEMHEWIENCFGFFSRIFSCLTFPYC